MIQWTIEQQFLVIDHNPDSRGLLTRSLRRKFQDCNVLQTSDAEEAVAALSSVNVDAVILHRAVGADAVEMVRSLRQVNPSVVIIVVSGVDRSESVLQAGATGFLRVDEWLMLGTMVKNAIEAENGK